MAVVRESLSRLRLTGGVSGVDLIIQCRPGEGIHISLCDPALEVLDRHRGKHSGSVVTYEGDPVRYVHTKASRNALKRAGISDFRWHGLRQTWASWLSQNGTPLYDLQEMGGRKSAAMVRRDAHLTPAHMARHAAVVDGLLRVTSTTQ